MKPINDEEVKDDLQVELEEEKLPMQVRERRQTVQVYEVFKEKAQWGEFYRVYGLCLFLLGGYFLWWLLPGILQRVKEFQLTFQLPVFHFPFSFLQVLCLVPCRCLYHHWCPFRIPRCARL